MSLKISIEPYFDEAIPNMGLEKYGMATFPETELQEDISKDENGRYLTGLDEYSNDVYSIEDEQEREAKVKSINEIKTRLEKIIGVGKLDATNKAFWGEFVLQVKNGSKELDMKRPLDEILYHAIIAGGFREVAPSYEVAKNSNILYKYYLKREEEEAAIRTQYSKLIDKANGQLVDMTDEDQYKMFLIAKNLLTLSHEFKRSTPSDIVYAKLREYITGESVKDDKKATVKKFLDTNKLDKESLTLKAYVNEALYRKFLVQEADGHFYNKQTHTRYGKNVNEVINYLKDPINQTELDNISTRVEKKWNS